MKSLFLLSVILLSSSLRTQLAFAADCFTSLNTPDVGGWTRSVAVADFNGDGKPDLAVAYDGNDRNVSVLLGTGNGTFVRGQDAAFSGTGSPGPVWVSDFNGDGKPDLAVASLNSGSFSILLGKGDGTFQRPKNYDYQSISGLAVSDFNGDGKADIVLAFGDAHKLTVLLGKGDGTFQSAINYDTSAANFHPSNALAVGDFNGDGKTDLVINGREPFGEGVWLMLGNGDGSFQLGQKVAGGSHVTFVSVGDFNRDGKPDLALGASYGQNNTNYAIWVMLGKGDSTFFAAAPYDLGTYSDSAAVGDFNGDRNPDIAAAVSDSNSREISVLFGNGDGSFQAPQHLATLREGVSRTVAVGDFNGDGKPDLAVGLDYNPEVAIWLNTCLFPVGLAIARTGTDVTVSWPRLFSDGFILESTSSLSLEKWDIAWERTISNNTRWQITAPAEQPQRYFRLRKL